MHKAPKHQGKALLLELNLKALNRKLGSYWHDVGKFVEFQRDPDVGKGLSYQEAVAFAATIHGISESTVARNYTKFRAHLKDRGLETCEEITSLKRFIEENKVVLQNAKNS
ncbi:hypothetical protein [Pseudomonas sp.]|uniref:hypothetical protein n=1 Tax=Pseudomonas sp. TaxID=306 RepID=UPI004053F52D